MRLIASSLWLVGLLVAAVYAVFVLVGVAGAARAAVADLCRRLGRRVRTQPRDQP